MASAHFPFPEEPNESLRGDRWATILFPDLLLAMIGACGYPPDLPDGRSVERRELADQMVEMSTFFVAAHEYTHVMLGHHAGASLGFPDGMPEDLPLSDAQEVEADRYGSILTLSFADREGYNLALAYWAIDFYFGAIQFLERFTARVVRPIDQVLIAAAAGRGFRIRMPRPAAGRTHPPVEGRRHVLREFYLRMPGHDPDAPTVLKAGLLQASRTDDFLAAVWEQSKDRFTSGLERCLRPRSG